MAFRSSAALLAWQVLSYGQAPAVLTSAHAVHSLTVEHARQQRPVHLRSATALVYLSRWNALFLADQTGGVFVDLTRFPKIAVHTGSLLEVEGVTGPGDFAPVIVPRKIRLLGEGRLPRGRPSSLEHLSTGVEDGQWVEIEGTVRSVDTGNDGLLTVVTAAGWSRLEVLTESTRRAEFASLIDAKVAITGVTGPVFNQRRQMIGVNLYTPGRAFIRVIEPAPKDPFAVPARPLGDILKYIPGEPPDHRIRIRGIVAAQSQGAELFLMDGTRGVSVRTTQTTSLRPGDVVDAVGFPAIGEYAHGLQDAIFRRVGTVAPPAPQSITAKQALAGAHNAHLVRIRGHLVSVQGTNQEFALRVASGDILFSAILPVEAVDKRVAGLRAGSLLELTGIYLVQSTRAARHFRVPNDFQLLMRSAQDIEVLQRPSWWTVENTLYSLGVTILIVLAALSWVFALRRRVSRQTRVSRFNSKKPIPSSKRPRQPTAQRASFLRT